MQGLSARTCEEIEKTLENLRRCKNSEEMSGNLRTSAALPARPERRRGVNRGGNEVPLVAPSSGGGQAPALRYSAHAHPARPERRRRVNRGGNEVPLVAPSSGGGQAPALRYSAHAHPVRPERRRRVNRGGNEVPLVAPSSGGGQAPALRYSAHAHPARPERRRGVNRGGNEVPLVAPSSGGGQAPALRYPSPPPRYVDCSPCRHSNRCEESRMSGCETACGENTRFRNLCSTLRSQ